ncbi:hydrolase [Enemella dayhoffiae]|uniref:Hydrolase n=1 Tax=Enemella dayhoffiae TaxID=2016507 RepID=A0A255H7K7_9ACTN|nr:alpha/beta fold hydrolase [Enemella dayhoffiae]OYO22694.1 hydrolase [Enemella dayhoffiae]
MSLLKEALNLPRTLLEYNNILLTTEDAKVGVTGKDEIWTYRRTTLFRFRSRNRKHPVPILLTFALINRPDIFDLSPENSFVGFLLGEGFDVYLVDWGYPQEEDSDIGIDDLVCDHLPWAIREVLRDSGAKEITLVGWCIGAVITSMYLALTPDAPVRNYISLTMPLDTEDTTFARWLGPEEFDVDQLADSMPYLPGAAVDLYNKLLKPVPNLIGTPLRLYQQVQDGTARRAAYQSMAKWVADNPNFTARAFQQWVTWMYKDNRLISGRIRLRGQRVDLSRITTPMLVVTASYDHIAPRDGTMPLFDIVSSTDIQHLDGVGGHIGLMAGSKARREIWPQISEWLTARQPATH